MSKYVNAPMEPSVLCQGMVKKMNYTESVYRRMQEQFSELRFGKPDLEYDEMWDFVQRLRPSLTPTEERTLLLPYHLNYNLRKVGSNVFYQLPKNFCQEYLKKIGYPSELFNELMNQ